MGKIQQEKIFPKLKQLLKNSYSPYSNFRVASIVIDTNGNYFCGVNVENASFTVGNCAERVAINNAITNGAKQGEIKEIHLLATKEKINNPNDLNKFFLPCGSCRQVISEMSNNNANIYIYNFNGKNKKETIENLIPNSFNKSDLIERE